jgi:DNA-binding response OmpR family regulator
MHEHRRLHAGVPVVVISATGAVAVTAHRLGASAWLRKPFELSALQRQLDALLADHRTTPTP